MNDGAATCAAQPRLSLPAVRKAAALQPRKVEMQRLLKWLEKPIDLLFWLGLVATVLMMMHVTVDVFSRYLFNRPLDGTTEIVAVIYMVVIAYAPWAWIQVRENHIVAGIFQDMGNATTDF